jgi:cytochrome c-type biogenesis protein CcmH/NrfG
MSSAPPYDPQTLKRLQDLGLDPYKKPLSPPPISSQTQITLPPKTKSSTLPLLAISGVSLLSVGSLIFFKNRTSPPLSPRLSNPVPNPQSQSQPTPTQIPKSIHHHLLTSQSFFSEATAIQQQNPQKAISLLNQAVDQATQALTLYPTDYRGFEQRAKIYSSLNSADPQESTSYLTQAIIDYQQAYQLKPDNASLTKQLATLWAKRGSVKDTLSYLNLTIQIEPTNAQNYYDLAQIQTQIGQIDQALATYQHLLPLLTDPTEKSKISQETSSLKNLLSQNQTATLSVTPVPDQPTLIENLDQTPTIQALVNTAPIIADSQESSVIEISGQSASNALSGTSLIPAGDQELVVFSTALTSSSRVYTTITKGGQNQILTIKSKSDSSFTVAIDSLATQDIEFKWWITN